MKIAWDERGMRFIRNAAPEPDEANALAVMHDAVLILAATSYSPVLDDDADLEHLFERGLLEIQRDWSEEYLTVSTREGDETVKQAIRMGEPIAELKSGLPGPPEPPRSWGGTIGLALLAAVVVLRFAGVL